MVKIENDKLSVLNTIEFGRVETISRLNLTVRVIKFSTKIINPTDLDYFHHLFKLFKLLFIVIFFKNYLLNN